MKKRELSTTRRAQKKMLETLAEAKNQVSQSTKSAVGKMRQFDESLSISKSAKSVGTQIEDKIGRAHV